MRSCFVLLLMTVLCLGCNRAEEARRKAVQDNLRQIGEDLQNYHQTHQSSETLGLALKWNEARKTEGGEILSAPA